MNNAIQQFREAMAARGILPPADLLADGKIHRCDTEGKGGKNDASYLLHPDDIPAGGFQNWRDGKGWQDWHANIGRTLTPAEKAAQDARIAQAQAARKAEEAKRSEEAQAEAAEIWRQTKPCTTHPYLTRKGIAGAGAREHGGALVLPVRDANGALHGLQFIGADGEKRFLPGTRKRGHYFAIGKPNGTLCIAEGFATAASIHEATGHAVAVAFDAGNLQPVAQALRAKFPAMRLVLCADDDSRTDDNPGITHATEAAHAVGGLLATPDFGANRPDGATDFNDLHQHAGAQAVKRCIEAAKAPQAGDSDGTGWPVPQPLTAKVEPEPYPLDALPETIRAAVEEVQAFVKAPVPLVASSALAALSLAAQAHIDVKRAEKLHAPVSLFLLTIADSGERKSTCDGFFTSAIRKYQEEQAEAMQPAITEYRAELAAWQAEHDGILSAIRDAGKKGADAGEHKADLQKLEENKPAPVRIPKMVHSDVTPEALAWALKNDWPSAGVLSSEAGVVFGSHGMSKDSAMRNLALLNVLWDGGELPIGRRTSESYTVRGARLTVGLMVQEATLREYFRKDGGLARGTGFLARFLVAWPQSTQGQRTFTEAPETWPHLSAFHRRIEAILNQTVAMDDAGALTPAMLTLAPEAKAEWIEFHDAVESELASGGELYDVRDVASKAADNVARLAALFHAFEHGTGGAIKLDSIKRASLIIDWHLNEGLRFFGELALPAELAGAARLDSWLIDHCRRERTHMVGKAKALQFSPLRNAALLDAAIRELAELDRVQLLQDGRRKIIKVNPALLEVAQ
ncbi:MAG: DUF3987 domain-containing protein [Rhodocyclaceae bacterium]|nr:DUF3987 domain-containing protein [Rhodocyclaceae bacterium]